MKKPTTTLLALRALIAREYRLAVSERTSLWITPAFVLLASAILAFSLSQVPVSPSILFAANSGLILCFACMLSLERWLVRDAENETLAIYILSSHSMLLFVCSKFIAFVLLRAIPTVLATAVAVVFYPRLESTPIFAFSIALPILLICSLPLAAVGFFVATLTMYADARAENALLLSLPLFLPPLMFAIACLEAGLASGESLVPFQLSLLLLCGTSLLALALLPIASFLLNPTNCR